MCLFNKVKLLILNHLLNLRTSFYIMVIFFTKDAIRESKTLKNFFWIPTLIFHTQRTLTAGRLDTETAKYKIFNYSQQFLFPFKTSSWINFKSKAPNWEVRLHNILQINFTNLNVSSCFTQLLALVHHKMRFYDTKLRHLMEIFVN